MMTAKSENSRKVQRLRGDVQRHQHLVERAVATKEGNPRDGADDAGGPERYRAEQEQNRAGHPALRTWKIRNQAILKPRNSVIAQTMTANFSELT